MTSTRIVAVLCLLALTIALAPSAVRAQGPVVKTWDVGTEPAGQLAVYNADSDGSALGMPCASGDLDGDGTDDAILAPFLAPSGASNARTRGGELRIVFGRRGDVEGEIDTASPGSGAVLVWGARANDNLGNEVDAADVTGDGLADILACAQNADGFATNSNRPGAGALYVIRGRAEWPDTLDLAEEPEGVTTILGATAGERCGFWASAGDVTGDGIKDILVSADLAAGPNDSGPTAGRLYVIPGSASLPARIDLGDQSQIAALHIVTIYGVDDCDHFGSCITSADFDADGFDDIVCASGVSRAGATTSKQASCGRGSGGGDGPNEDRSDAGEAYVIYGRADWPAQIRLSNPTPDVAIYYGQNSGDHFGEDVRAGDFDGDGRPELCVGALTASVPSGTAGTPSRSRAGAGYIFWGSLLARGERVDLRDLNSSSPRVTRLYGERAGDIGADTVALVDVDMDGLAEVVFASPLFDPSPGRSEAGDVKVIFGSSGRLPGIVDFANPPASVEVYRIIARDPGDMFAYSFTQGDFNGDGYTDLLPNAMGGDGNGNCCRDAGELYVISGRAFSDFAGRSPAGAPCLTSVEVAPPAARHYAGESGIVLTLRCEDTGAETPFVAGAVAVVDGVEIPATFVDAHTLVVRLDDAPGVRNTPGPLAIAVRNPSGPVSAAVNALVLVGPEITRVKAKRGGGLLKLNVKGTDFLPGATLVVTNGAGEEITLASVVRKSVKKIRATVELSAVTSGEQLTVRVANPGPALSNAATATVP
jgi:hypothetical protein